MRCTFEEKGVFMSNIPLPVSGLILILAGVLFGVSAGVSRQIYLWAACAVCCLCGLLLILSRRKKGKRAGGEYLSD